MLSVLEKKAVFISKQLHNIGGALQEEYHRISLRFGEERKTQTYLPFCKSKINILAPCLQETLMLC